MNGTYSKRASKKVLKILISLAIIMLVSIVIINVLHNSSTTVYGQDLLKNITPNKVTATGTLPDDFISATTDFSINLFKQSINTNKNSLISPTSVALVLGMTANGADGKTLEQLKNLLGGNKYSIDQLNGYYYTMSSKLQSDTTNKIRLANSVWYSQDKSLNVKPDFLQANADFYKAAAYKADFNSHKTVDKINNWVKSNTDGLIDEIISEIDDASMMLLLNTVLFEAEWDIVYETLDLELGNFTLSNGQSVKANFMRSDESYLKGSTAIGFIKPYKDKKYSFVAILPNRDIPLEDYINTLDEKSFLNFINSESNELAHIGLPKFKYDYEISLTKPLVNLGFTEGFDKNKANFSKMVTTKHGNIYIDDSRQKTFIQVDELGTKADAVTMYMVGSSGLITKEVNLDRPFVYAIIENDTKLPLFIGTVMDPTK